MQKYDKAITIRLPDNLKGFEALGFSNMSEFVKTALEDYILRHNYEVAKASAILDQIGEMITVMEADRDYNPETWTDAKDDLLTSLYSSAKILSITAIMQQDPVNQIPTLGEDGKPDGKVYKYQWAL